MINEILTPQKALPKIKHFCAYQERCHQEVKDKLYSYGLRRDDVEQILAELVAENYLSEQRFAEQFAGGRFRLKHWGKVKIRYELKQKFVSEYCIKKALNAIDLDDYELMLKKLALEKWNSLSREKNVPIRKRKVLNYLLQKGYESDLSLASIKILSEKK